LIFEAKCFITLTSTTLKRLNRIKKFIDPRCVGKGDLLKMYRLGTLINTKSHQILNKKRTGMEVSILFRIFLFLFGIVIWDLFGI